MSTLRQKFYDVCITNFDMLLDAMIAAEFFGNKSTKRVCTAVNVDVEQYDTI